MDGSTKYAHLRRFHLGGQPLISTPGKQHGKYILGNAHVRLGSLWFTTLFDRIPTTHFLPFKKINFPTFKDDTSKISKNGQSI